MIKAVIFDCFGVLIGDAYVAIKTAHPEIISEMAVLSRKAGLGEITSAERQDMIVELLNETGIDGRAVLTGAIDGIQRNPALLKEIKTLRKKCKVGLLSNVGVGFWKRFSKEETEVYFDDVVLSYQVGLVKPDAEIFKLATERLDVSPSECVFIDDDERNVRAAEKCGMKGIVYEWGMDIEKALGKFGVSLRG